MNTSFGFGLQSVAGNDQSIDDDIVYQIRFNHNIEVESIHGLHQNNRKSDGDEVDNRIIDCSLIGWSIANGNWHELTIDFQKDQVLFFVDDVLARQFSHP